jgi:diguanylate cyclase (GGDEF)-like protein/PAS domain S-box-containing protein
MLLALGAGLLAALAGFAWWRTQRALRHARAAQGDAAARLYALLDTSPDAILSVDAAGRVVLANQQAEALTGYTHAELIGQPVEMLIPPTEAGNHAALFTAYLQSPTKRPMAARRPLAVRRKTGELVSVEISLGPAERADSAAVTCFIRDLSEQVQTQVQLRLQSVALESAANGIVITDRQGRILWTNPAFTRMTGYTADEAIGRKPSLLKSGQHDEQFYRTLWQTVLAGQVWQGETINRRKDGSLYVEEQTIAPVRDESGQITDFVAIKQDVTPRKQAEAVVRQQADQLAALNHAMQALSATLDQGQVLARLLEELRAVVPFESASVWLLDNDRLEIAASQGLLNPGDAGRRTIDLAGAAGAYGRVVRTRAPVILETEPDSNAASPETGGIRAWLGVPLLMGDRLIGTLALDRLTPGAFQPAHAQLALAFASQAAIAIENARLYTAAQQEVAERGRAETGLREANKRLQVQLAEIVALQVQLQEQAIRDPLTGLFNRRYLAETLERELARAHRAGTVLSVVLLDVDRFKLLNDNYGHKAGDLVLQALARLLQSDTRHEDIACRYGGEEFVLVLVGAPPPAAAQRAERWRLACEAQSVMYEGWDLRTTISLGVAAYPQHGVTTDELLKAADRALYQAKSRGRNQVAVAESRPTAPLVSPRERTGAE